MTTRGDSETTISTTSAAYSGDPAGMTPGVMLGRYLVIEELGRGGMGVVLRAYDPKLSREVALKVLRNVSREAEARLVREARAMAQLSHPNTVSVYDVDFDSAQILLAMELVTGVTMATWLDEAPRPVDQVVRTFVAAGRGLAAAHAAGLLHRDFKPSNVLLGPDGAVMVTDFGLARVLGGPSWADDDRGVALRSADETLSVELTEAGTVMGTRAFMAPEQHDNSELTPATDQFAYCVSLWYALTGERPYLGDDLPRDKRAGPPPWPTSARVPRGLVAAIRRGLAPDPAERWPSMNDLIAELSRDPARARRIWLGLAGCGLAVAAGIGIWQLERSRTQAACDAQGAEIEAVWNDDARERVRVALLATGVSYARTTVAKTIPLLDEHARAWREHRAQACLSVHSKARWDTAMVDRAVWCLDERRLELDSLVTELARADADVASRAVAAAAGMTRTSLCVDEDVLAKLPQTPSGDALAAVADVRVQLARARTLNVAGKLAEGLEVATQSRSSAETIGWPPLLAAALRQEAALLEATGAYAAAEETNLSAYVQAGQARAWETAVSAAEAQIALVGHTQRRHAEGRTWARHAELAASLAGDPLGMRQAARDSSLAMIHHGVGELAEARALFERSLASHEAAFGADHLGVAGAHNNLAIIVAAMGDHDEAMVRFERALQIREAALGADHPSVATSLNNLAALSLELGVWDRAQSLSERAVAIWEAALGPEHRNVAAGLNNLANAHRGIGELSESEAIHLRALQIREHALGVDHPDVAQTLGNLGTVYARLEQHTRACTVLQRAIAIYDAHEGVQEDELSARFALARALVGSGGDLARARHEATRARDGYRERGRDDAREEVEQWLEQHADDAAPPLDPAGEPI